MFLSNISVKRPVLATMLNLIFIIFGVFIYHKLGVEQFPNVDFPVVVVNVAYPGADPASVEQKLLKLMERKLNGLEGLDSMTSVAAPNMAQIILQFKLEIDGDKAAQNVRDKVGIIQGDKQYPSEATIPTVTKFNVGDAPVLNLAFSSSSMKFSELSRLAQDVVKPSLEQVKGVGSADLVGDRLREVHILLNRSTLQSFKLTPEQVMTAIKNQLSEVPGGKVENSQDTIRIKTTGIVNSAEAIGNIPVSLSSGDSVFIKDVAKIQDTLAEEVNYGENNGNTAVIISIKKQSGGNTVQIAKGVREKVEEISKNLPEGTQLRVTYDGSKYIKGSIDAVIFDLFLGAILAVLIVLLFLHDFRATIITALAIPTAVIGTLAIIYYLGFTLNIMTTLALTLSIGLLIDDAIVVIENIFRHLQMKKSAFDAARDGTSEIGMAAIAITLSVLSVFVPVAFMDGMMGRFFFSFGVTVAVAVALSLFVAFTLTPMLSSKMLKPHDVHKTNSFFQFLEKYLQIIENKYKSILSMALNHRWKTLGIGVFAFLFSIFVLLPFVPKSFFPKEDKSKLTVVYTLPADTPLSLTRTKAKKLVNYIQSYPGIKDTILTIGGDNDKAVYKASVEVFLVNKGERTYTQFDLTNRLREELQQKFSEINHTIEVNESSDGGGGSPQPIQLILSHPDDKTLKEASAHMKDFIKNKVPFTIDVTTNEPPIVEEVHIIPDPALASDVGLSASSIGNSMRVLFDREGQKVGEIEDKGLRFDVRLRMDESSALTKNDILGQFVFNNKGVPISLPSIADVKMVKADSKINRRSGMRNVTILSNFTGQDISSAVSAIENEVKRAYPNVNYVFDGQAKLMKEAITAMMSTMLLAIILVFMVLCAQFESYLVPFVIILTIPLAFSGAFGALLATQKALSVYGMIGLIMLMGLVTKNAILLVDFSMNRIRKDGLKINDAILEAGPIRLRPILMTTLAMIFGMLPIAIGHGEGGEARAPMAITVIGGLVSSTLLTLVVIPCVLSLLLHFINRRTNGHVVS